MLHVTLVVNKPAAQTLKLKSVGLRREWTGAVIDTSSDSPPALISCFDFGHGGFLQIAFGSAGGARRA